MDITVFEQTEGLHGTPEVWVKVQTDKLLDWPRYKSALTPTQAKLLEPCSLLPDSYHPARAEADETPLYRYEEWFIFKKYVPAKARA